MSKDLKEKRKAEAEYLRQAVHSLKNEMKKEKEFQANEDTILHAAIRNVEEGLVKFEMIDELAPKEQARIYADVSFLMGMIEGVNKDDECDMEEDEDASHGHGGCCGGHHHH